MPTSYTADTGCVFCRIVAGAEPASMVHQDEVAVAFLDIRPVTPGHLLVVPRQHLASLVDLDPEIAAHLMRVAVRLDRALRSSGLPCQGVNLFLADGEAAGQDVFHVHLHLFPRFEGDGVRLSADWARPARGDLDELAERIRSALLSPRR
jgi:histidine triad (HIT) family protein